MIHLYLDFDGVLHSRPLDDEGLFCWLDHLVDLVAPYPALRIIISSSWAETYSLKELRDMMPEKLSAKIMGTTLDGYSGKRSDFYYRYERGEQVLLDATWRSLPEGSWLAIDDDSKGWGSELNRLVHCHPQWGLSDETTRKNVARKLASLAHESQSF